DPARNITDHIVQVGKRRAARGDRIRGMELEYLLSGAYIDHDESVTEFDAVARVRIHGIEPSPDEHHPPVYQCRILVVRNLEPYPAHRRSRPRVAEVAVEERPHVLRILQRLSAALYVLVERIRAAAVLAAG